MIVNIGKSGIDFNDFRKNLYENGAKAEAGSSGAAFGTYPSAAGLLPAQIGKLKT